MTKPPPPSSAPGRGTPALRIGVAVHVTAWSLVIAALLAIHHEDLAPSARRVALVTAGVLVVLAVGTWLRGRLHEAALVSLNVLSIAALAVLVLEVWLSAAHPEEVDFMRHPYAFRMHGFAPMRRADDNTYRATSDASGLRGGAPTGPRRAGERRVIVLGGSAVFGVGDADDETIPFAMQQALDESVRAGALPGVDRVVVVNAGQGWYTTTNELVFLVTELVYLQPDLVVAIDGYNDVHHSLIWQMPVGINPPTADAVASLEHLPGTYRSRTWSGALATALSCSQLCRQLGLTEHDVLTTTFLAENEGLVDVRRARSNLPPEIPRRLVSNWALMDGACRRSGCRVLVALQPVLYDRTHPDPSEQAWLDHDAHREIMAAAWTRLQTSAIQPAEALGIATFRVDEAVRDAPGQMFQDACHMTAAANRLVGRAAAERVVLALASAPPREDGVELP